MALPTSREEFREYCLRALGKPVIEINVDLDQVEDRIDEALSYYADYHFDGSEKIYYKYQTSDAAREHMIKKGYDGLRYNGGQNMDQAERHDVYIPYNYIVRDVWT